MHYLLHTGTYSKQKAQPAEQQTLQQQQSQSQLWWLHWELLHKENKKQIRNVPYICNLISQIYL